LAGLPSTERVRRVHEQVDEDLPEPEGVRARRRVRVVEADDPRAVTELHRRDLHGRVEHRVHVDGSRRLLVAAPERAHHPHDPPHAIGAVERVRRRLREQLDGGKRGDGPRALRASSRDELEVEHDVRERVVQLVRDAAREAPERRHAIGEEVLDLELLARRHVADDPRSSRGSPPPLR
jgi:hypothetical protein